MTGIAMPITIDCPTLHSLCLDRFGICLSCRSGTDPVELNAAGEICDACGQQAVVGVLEAMRRGVIVLEEGAELPQ